MQRPTSLVCVLRFGDQRLQLGAVRPAKIGEVGGGVARRHGPGGGPEDVGHRVVVRGQRVRHARQKQVVHGRQQQERAALGERCAVEQRKHLGVVGCGATDGRVDGAAVALDDGGEAAEVVRERLVDQGHRLSNWLARAG